jgi:Uma2 family endonuclease
VLDDRSEPEPDVCVVRGSPRDYAEAHPRHPALVVEVARSGLRLARGRKATAYARTGIAEYWIVDLARGVLDVHREPVGRGRGRRGGRYARVASLAAEATVSPLAAPGAVIRVADLLP